MEIHQLRYFAAVAEEMHFGRAADRLMVTPSPLSKQIRRLERELGGDLFVRDHHSVRLTPLGAEILEPVRDILERVDSLRAVRRMRSERLRLGATPLGPIRYLDRTRTALELILEGAPLDLTLAPTSQLLPQLDARKIDFALVYRPVPDDRFESYDVGSHNYLVGMRHDDPLATSAGLALSDLANGTFVLSTHNYHLDYQRRLHDRLRDAGVNTTVEVAHGNIAAVQAHIRLLGARALVPDVDGHPTREAFDDSSFALVPLADDRIKSTTALVALTNALRDDSLLLNRFNELYAALEELNQTDHDEPSADSPAPFGEVPTAS